MLLAPTLASNAAESLDAANNPQADLLHLLRRSAFGTTPAEWRAAEKIGPWGWVERQLDYESIDDSAIEALIAEYLPTVAMTQEALNELSGDEEFTPQRIAAELKLATIARAAYSPRRLYEMMVDFWSNHFNITHQDVNTRILKTADDRAVIRPHAMGLFADMLNASARSPAMLYYLDNYSNTVDGPNENYARELMELHTIGVEGGYSEDDVKEVARCLTGWGISRRPNGGLFRFYPRLHDQGEKTVLGVTIPAGGGMEDGQTVLDMLAAHASTANYIADKLCRRFVADERSPALVERVAGRFSDSGGNIRESLSELLFSNDFFATKGRKFKRPMELLTSAVAALDVDWSEGGIRTLRQSLNLLGQLPFDWAPPTGYPDTASAWVSSSALINRWNEMLALGAGRKPGLLVDYSVLTDSANSPEELADAIIDALLHEPIVATDRQILVDYLRAGGNRFRELTPIAVALVVASPYFQYR